jgi:hypothetical protein
MHEGLRKRMEEGETLLPAFATCRYCLLGIQPVVVWTSGLIDWESDGDAGCANSPETNEEGTGSHSPMPI